MRGRVVAGSASSNRRSVSDVFTNGPRTLVPYSPGTAGDHIMGMVIPLKTTKVPG